MTTRNVRAYQDRGLLPPPRRSGRVALYDDTHVARLRLIGSMLERGYTTAHISEMLTAWEHGKNLADVLGVEEALVRPWGADQPVSMPVREVRAQAGDPAAFERLVELGLVTVRGQQATVARPKLLAAFAELRGYGLPSATLIDLYADTLPALDDVARRLVATAAGHFATSKGPSWVPDADELGELTEVLARFRTLAMDSVTDTLATSMERTVEQVLGAYLAHLTAEQDDAEAGQRAQEHAG